MNDLRSFINPFAILVAVDLDLAVSAAGDLEKPRLGRHCDFVTVRVGAVAEFAVVADDSTGPRGPKIFVVFLLSNARGACECSRKRLARP